MGPMASQRPPQTLQYNWDPVGRFAGVFLVLSPGLCFSLLLPRSPSSSKRNPACQETTWAVGEDSGVSNFLLSVTFCPSLPSENARLEVRRPVALHLDSGTRGRMGFIELCDASALNFSLYKM